MRRVAVGAVAAAVLAVPAAVVAGDLDIREYGGKVDRDPGQYITFDVVKKHGKRFVTHIGEANAPFTCADPMADGPASGTLEGRFRIKNGAFAGKKSYDFGMRRRSTGIFYSIEGEFVKKRKIRGEYKMRLRGGDTDPCVTGKLPFVARKPAPPPPKP